MIYYVDDEGEDRVDGNDDDNDDDDYDNTLRVIPRDRARWEVTASDDGTLLAFMNQTQDFPLGPHFRIKILKLSKMFSLC